MKRYFDKHFDDMRDELPEYLRRREKYQSKYSRKTHARFSMNLIRNSSSWYKKSFEIHQKRFEQEHQKN